LTPISGSLLYESEEAAYELIWKRKNSDCEMKHGSRPRQANTHP